MTQAEREFIHTVVESFQHQLAEIRDARPLYEIMTNVHACLHLGNIDGLNKAIKDWAVGENERLAAEFGALYEQGPQPQAQQQRPDFRAILISHEDLKGLYDHCTAIDNLVRQGVPPAPDSDPDASNPDSSPTNNQPDQPQ